MGALVPALRPAALAEHKSSSLGAILHAMENFTLSDHIMLLQPTSPLRSTFDVKESWRIYERDPTRSLVSVCELPQKPATLFSLMTDVGDPSATELGGAAPRYPEQRIHYLNGAVFLFSQTYVKERMCLFDERSHIYEMPPERSVDVDTELDFQVAEFLLSRMAAS
jgi:N-acylneuraminate cytidylyltransferase/CMP-N,N'-diacetyllegionaminic acid synthase